MAAPLPVRSGCSPSPPTTRGTRRSARCCAAREIDHVTTPDAGARPRSTHAHDIALVDREIDPPGTDGLHARRGAGPPAAADAGDRALPHGRQRGRRGGRGGRASPTSCSSPGSRTDRLEHAIRYAITHQRDAAAPRRVRGAPRARAARRQRRPLGLGRRGATGLLLAALEVDARLPRARGRRDARRVARPRARRRPRAAHAGARRLRAARAGASTFEFEHRAAAPRRQLPLDARARDRGARRATAARPASSAASPTSPTAARPSAACSTTRSTTTLTGLPNRVLFVDRLDQSIRRAQRHHPECCAAVLFLDLDRFKVINDSLGHAVGDELLQAVARRLEAALRPNDTVARLSGDEFTLLLDDVCEAREATVIAERVLQSLQAPFLLDGRELFIGASIGIALATRAVRAGAGDARRRRRDVPREGRRQGPPRGLRRRDAPAGDAPARPGARTANRDRAAARWRSATSRSCRPRQAGSSASRRSAAGRTASPRRSWRWPRRRGWPSRSAARSSGPRARSSRSGARCRAARG